VSDVCCFTRAATGLVKGSFVYAGAEGSVQVSDVFVFQRSWLPLVHALIIVVQVREYIKLTDSTRWLPLLHTYNQCVAVIKKACQLLGSM
jgi:hypothetical protein